MKCSACGFDLPEDFPLVALKTPDGGVKDWPLCAPCARLQVHAVIRSAEGFNRTGVITR